MKAALVHDWLTGMRGGENVLEELCRMFPDADLYTLVHFPGTVSPIIEDRKIITSFLQTWPGVETKYRWFLPLMPTAIERFELKGYDLVISSSHCVAKGVRPGGAPHLCYLHTPMRYAWDLYDDYFNPTRLGRPTLFVIEKIMPYLRDWDRRTVSRVGKFVANSLNVAERVRTWYRVEAEVAHPPVDVGFFTPARNPARGTYLMVTAFAPYKRVDLAIQTFNRRREPLLIVGSGEDEARLRAMAGPTVRFEAPVEKERLRELFRNARALIYPGEEDFGIIPVEAMACGTPVIAYGKGGVLETIVPLRGEFIAHPTGVFFDRQTVDDLDRAISRFEAHEDRFDPATLRKEAERFARPVFREKMEKLIETFLS